MQVAPLRGSSTWLAVGWEPGRDCLPGEVAVGSQAFYRAAPGFQREQRARRRHGPRVASRMFYG